LSNSFVVEGAATTGRPNGRSTDIGAPAARPRLEPTAPPERPLLRRRTLPGGRAVVGGLLIAAAIVTVFISYTAATRQPRQLYVVASHLVPAGTRLNESDLRLVPLNLPDAGVRQQVFSSPALLVGATVIAPLASGALIEASAVVGRGGPPGTREVSISVDRARAVAGTLKAGEYVDLLGTFGTGADAYTTEMVPHLRVIALTSQSSALGDQRTQLITFAAPTDVAAEAIADAAIAAQVTLVRSAESPGRSDGGPDPTVAPAPAYRAPGGPVTRGGA
jgi:Flp pilus assembly protein CpaB